MAETYGRAKPETLRGAGGLIGQDGGGSGPVPTSDTGRVTEEAAKPEKKTTGGYANNTPEERTGRQLHDPFVNV